MLTIRVCKILLAGRWGLQHPASLSRFHLLVFFFSLCWAAPLVAKAQEFTSVSRVNIAIARQPVPKQPVESENTFPGIASHGNEKAFAASWDTKPDTAGLNYDGHSWGHFAGARLGDAAELLPLLTRNAPTVLPIWGNPYAESRQLVSGVAIEPIGLRMQWRPQEKWKASLTAKSGMIVFERKAPSADALYETFSPESGIGLQARLSGRLDLRFGLFGDYRFANGYIMPLKSELNAINAGMGLSYHLGRRTASRVQWACRPTAASARDRAPRR